MYNYHIMPECLLYTVELSLMQIEGHVVLEIPLARPTERFVLFGNLHRDFALVTTPSRSAQLVAHADLVKVIGVALFLLLRAGWYHHAGFGHRRGWGTRGVWKI